MSNEKMELTKEDVEQMIEVGVKKNLSRLYRYYRICVRPVFGKMKDFT